MRIGIDARFYGPIGKGLGRYTQEITDGITSLDDTNEYVVFLRPENFLSFSSEKNKKVKKVLVNFGWYTMAEQFFFPFLIFREKINLMHFPHFNVPIMCPCKFIVTIHDLILTRYPTLRASTLSPLFYQAKKICYKIVIKIAAMRSRAIITVSNFTKNDIIKKLKIKKGEIFVIYEGASDLSNQAWRNMSNNTDTNDKKINLGYNNIHNQYLLYVGNAYPHKNLKRLIHAFQILLKDNEDLKLVLVGKEDFFYSRVKNYCRKIKLTSTNDTKSKVMFTGFVQDEQLKLLYQNALAYIFPSLYEGFGLPPLEAMSNGCPVVSSNRASMPEILGSAAVYFDPENVQDMVDKIELVIRDESLKSNLKILGFQQIAKYNWSECVKQTLHIYNSQSK